MSNLIDWDLAQTTAQWVSGRFPHGNSDLTELTADFARFTPQAETLVLAETGWSSTAPPAKSRVVSRHDWIAANISSFKRLLKPILDGPIGQQSSIFTPITSRVAAMQMGSLLGWMSTRVLGQYDLLVLEDENPDEQDVVYYVGANIAQIEKDQKFDPQQFRLWIALHEVTHRAQFTAIPWMQPYFLTLTQDALSLAEPDPMRFFRAIGQAADDIRQRKNPLAAGGFAALFATAEQRVTLDKIGGLMSLLEGHGDVTMNRAGKDLVPLADHFAGQLSQRRNNAAFGTRLLQQAIGLEAKMRQYQDGEDFIHAIESAGGPQMLQQAFTSPDHLPTLDEIQDPTKWVTRITASVAR